MTTVQDIINHVESLTGKPLRRDEGVMHGSADRAVTGAVVCWIPSPEAIREAAQRGAQLVIGHECLDFPDWVAQWAPDRTDASPGWAPNRQRHELLDQYGLACLRIHGSADEICVFDDFAAMLEMGAPVHEQGFVKVYEIEPLALGELIERVKRQTGMAHLRVAGAADLDKRVGRVGLPWGGYGLFVNAGYQQRLIELGCDVFIAGEACNYGFRFAAECGVPMIETSHEISENPGLRRLTAILDDAFDDVSFHFHENACAWRWF